MTESEVFEAGFLVDGDEYDLLDELVYAELENGKVDLSMHLPGEIVSGPEVEPFAFIPHFSITSIVDDLICVYGIDGSNDVISADERPLVDALRKELLEQAARLGAMTFK